jgi:hypothetical protein
MRRIKTSIKLIAFQTFAFLLSSTATGAAEPGSIIRTKSPNHASSVLNFGQAGCTSPPTRFHACSGLYESGRLGRARATQPPGCATRPPTRSFEFASAISDLRMFSLFIW